MPGADSRHHGGPTLSFGSATLRPYSCAGDLGHGGRRAHRIASFGLPATRHLPPPMPLPPLARGIKGAGIDCAPDSIAHFPPPPPPPSPGNSQHVGVASTHGRVGGPAGDEAWPSCPDSPPGRTAAALRPEICPERAYRGGRVRLHGGTVAVRCEDALAKVVRLVAFHYCGSQDRVDDPPPTVASTSSRPLF